MHDVRVDVAVQFRARRLNWPTARSPSAAAAATPLTIRDTCKYIGRYAHICCEKTHSPCLVLPCLAFSRLHCDVGRTLNRLVELLPIHFSYCIFFIRQSCRPVHKVTLSIHAFLAFSLFFFPAKVFSDDARL